jgi:murein L,D-transpeptidase YcbB/YkuD
VRFQWSRLIFGLVLLLDVTGVSAQEGEDIALRETLAQLSGVSQTRIAGQRLASIGNLAAFYERRHYRPLWTQPTAQALISTLNAADAHGLRNTDYHVPALQELVASYSASGAVFRARFDILATDALLRYAHHLRYGKVDPEKLFPRWNLSDPDHRKDMFDAIAAVVDHGSISEWLASLAPSFPVYSGMQRALARYRRLAAQGGWPTLPAGPWLQLGVRHPQIVTLRKRLRVTGDLSDAQVADPAEFGATLDEAVRCYQRRNGLAVDGIVGPRTRAALNIPAEVRLQQLRINLERARWVLHNIKTRTVVVNLAAFSLYLADQDQIQWSSRVVIGRTYRKTPVFRSQIRYLVLNPSWVVPPTIFREDILPLAIKDPGAIRAKNLKVLTGTASEIAPESVDWQRYRSAPFPYTLRQDPGPANTLGRIKFVFPNPYTVFMHDTPQRELFGHSDRAFSSGCIRLANPMELAVLLLSGAKDWDQARLLSAVETGRTQTITLPEPVDIVIMYWTAGVDPRGIVHFRNDIYKRDPAVLAALDRDL